MIALLGTKHASIYTLQVSRRLCAFDWWGSMSRSLIRRFLIRSKDIDSKTMLNPVNQRVLKNISYKIVLTPQRVDPSESGKGYCPCLCHFNHSSPSSVSIGQQVIPDITRFSHHGHKRVSSLVPTSLNICGHRPPSQYFSVHLRWFSFFFIGSVLFPDFPA
jgi:hypothetical protein